MDIDAVAAAGANEPEAKVDQEAFEITKGNDAPSIEDLLQDSL